MLKHSVFALFAVLSAASVTSLTACGGNAPPANTGGDTSGGGGAGGGGGTGGGGDGAAGGGGGTVDAQVAQGKSLYAENCASCHGVNGEGKGSPAIIGKAAMPLDPPGSAKKRKGQFKTAADVFTFTKATMPVGNTGSLKDDEYYAILAYTLKTGGTDVGAKKLDASNAASINLR